MLRREHISLIARHHLKHSLRGGAGLVFIFLGLVAGLICAQLVIGSLEMCAEERSHRRPGDGGQPEAPAAVHLALVLEQIVLSDPEQASGESRGSSRCSSSSRRRWRSWAASTSCRAISGPRACATSCRGPSAANLFFGRLLGAVLQAVVVFALLFAIVTLYVTGKVKLYPAGDMALWMAAGYLRLMILLLPYLALCAFISASIDTPFAALTVGLAVVCFVPLLGFMAGRSNQTAGEVVDFLLPGGYKWWLFHPSIGMVPRQHGRDARLHGAVLMLGWRHFERRDL